MYFPQRHHNVHNKNQSHDQDDIVFYRQDPHTHTNLQTNKPSAQMLEKRKDKQIQDLEHKNESLQQEMSVKRHTNIDTIQDFEDTYYHRGLIVLDDLEKEGYYTFHCNICEYAFWEGASKCYEDQQAHQQHCLQPFR
eukprot:467657_1